MGNGAKAKRSGTDSEILIKDICRNNYGLISEKKLYEAIWHKKVRTEKDAFFPEKYFIDNKNLCLEVKRQSGGGGAEARFFGELPNILENVIKSKKYPNNFCDRVCIILLGEHWEQDNPHHAQNARKFIENVIDCYGFEKDNFSIVVGVEEFKKYMSSLPIKKEVLLNEKNVA